MILLLSITGTRWDKTHRLTAAVERNSRALEEQNAHIKRGVYNGEALLAAAERYVLSAGLGSAQSRPIFEPGDPPPLASTVPTRSPEEARR